MSQKSNILLHLDPSISSQNTGDLIISEAIESQLSEISQTAFQLKAPTQFNMGRLGIRLNKGAVVTVVGGTNLLTSFPLQYRQWQISFAQAFQLRNVVLMGVGWWQYQAEPSLFGQTFLRAALSSKIPHSVRDRHTQTKLLDMGFRNVIYTGCPTMWGLSPEHCKSIPTQKGDSAIVTITDYKPDHSVDKEWLEAVAGSYKKIFFWPQGAGDLEYFTSLGVGGFEYLPPSLRAFNSILEKVPRIDYVGTRLHGGIRAMQFGKRALVLQVDNRAAEISKDTGLPVIDRKEVAKIRSYIDGSYATVLDLPVENIREWKASIRSLFERPGGRDESSIT